MPVSNPVRMALSTPWTAALGIAAGLAIAPGGGFDWAWALYDDLRPVLSMEGQVVSRTPTDVVVAIRGTKHRACQYLAIRAYAERDGLLVDANSERVDRVEDGHTKPPGVYDIGNWRIWPIDGATVVKMYAKHSCDGRLVISKVAEVSVKQ